MSRQPRLPRRKIAVIVGVAVVLAAGVFYFFPSTILGPCYSLTSGTWRSFAIVATLDGYNGSRYHQFVMTVPNGDCVSIAFINMDQQPHGLAISYYTNGVIAQPGQAASIRFEATTTGQFQVGEQIVSTISAWTDRCGWLDVV